MRRTLTLLLFLPLIAVTLHAQPGTNRKLDAETAGESRGSVALGMQFMIGEGMSPPAIRPSSPSIEYPEIALIQGIEGSVSVKVLVSETGVVSLAEVTESSDTLFTEAVMSVIRDFTFDPAKDDKGLAMPMSVRMDIRFLTEDDWLSGFSEGESAAGEEGDSWAYVSDVVLPKITDSIFYQHIVHPESAKARNSYGTVTLRVLVDTNGQVLKMEVDGVADHELAQAAIAAVGATPFTAGSEGGRRTEMWGMVPINFARTGVALIDAADKKSVEENAAPENGGIVAPSYSQGELEKNFQYKGSISGTVTVTLRVLVTETGVIEQVLVSNEVDALISKAAVDAVKKTPFTPGTQNGTPIPVWITVEMAVRAR